MASGASGEVVHCPNCKEDVPKTLYCLNCGFPLYKEEQPKEEKIEPEVKPAPEKPVEEDAVIMVDDEEEEPAKPEELKAEPSPEVLESKEEVQQVGETPDPQVESTIEPEAKEEAPAVEETPDPQVESTIEPEAKPEPTQEPEPMSEATDSVVESVPVVEAAEKLVETAPPVVEASPAQIEALKPAETPSEPSSTGIEASKKEAVVMVEELHVQKTFAPDPLSKDLLENFVKNISMKLKLIKLYRDGAVKEETFTRLFEGYLKEGKIWFSRRSEILKKLADEVEEMEDAYAKATEALELLEVRKIIGEASVDEYTAKSPAYRWDIENFDNLIGDKRNRTAYLENVSNALTDAELKELKELASIQYNTLESLQISKDEFLATIKDDLYETIKILG